MLLVVRSWQQYRTTGRAGFNGFQGARTLPAGAAGIRFVGALLMGVLSPILAWLHVLPLLWPGSLVGRRTHSGRWGRPGVGWSGACYAAQGTMGTSWRIGVDTNARSDLVTHGCSL